MADQTPKDLLHPIPGEAASFSAKYLPLGQHNDIKTKTHVCSLHREARVPSLWLNQVAEGDLTAAPQLIHAGARRSKTDANVTQWIPVKQMT